MEKRREREKRREGFSVPSHCHSIKFPARLQVSTVMAAPGLQGYCELERERDGNTASQNAIKLMFLLRFQVSLFCFFFP